MEPTLNSIVQPFPVKSEPVAPVDHEPACCPAFPELFPPPEPVGDVAVALLGAFGIGTVVGALLTYSFSRKSVECSART